MEILKIPKIVHFDSKICIFTANVYQLSVSALINYTGQHGHMVIDADECKLQLTWDLVQLWGEGEVIVQSACCQCYDDTSFSLCQSFTLSPTLAFLSHTYKHTDTQTHTEINAQHTNILYC